MKKQLVGLLLFWMMTLMSCNMPDANTAATRKTATATPEIKSVAAGYLEQKMFDDMTQTQNQRTEVALGAILTLTQQVLNATATMEAHRENLQGTARADGATQQVWKVTVAAQVAADTATAEAHVAETQQAYVMATGTAQRMAVESTRTAEAQDTETQQAVLGLTATIAARETATADYKTEQAPFVQAQQTAVKAQAESAELAASRERMTNGVIAWGPWLIAVVAVAAFIFVTIRKSQVGTIDRDENGMMPGVVIFNHGRKQFIVPDRMFSPVLTMDRNGISAPQMATPELQEGTTRRAQAVEAINALPQQAQKQGFGLMAQTFNTTSRPAIEVMEPGQVRGWVDEAETKLGEEL